MMISPEREITTSSPLVLRHVAHRGIEADHAVGLGFHARSDGSTRSGTTDVEGTHGQLRAGFTDGLGGDHADGFAEC